jgi:hypothetical protein
MKKGIEILFEYDVWKKKINKNRDPKNTFSYLCTQDQA